MYTESHEPQNLNAKETLLPENVNKSTTPEEVAKSIVDNPNLWGMYSIADAIHKLLYFQKKIE